MIQTMRKGKFGRGVEICEGGPYAHGFERGGGSKSAVTPVIKLKNI